MYFQFLDPVHIIALFILLITIGLVFFRFKKSFIINERALNYVTNKKVSIIRLTSLIICIALLAIAILGPTGLINDSSTTTEGIDCVWLLDVSASMDAEDFTDGQTLTSRLVRAKSVIENYIISHPENRYGLVIFAGTSRLISPLTSEHSSILSFLASIDSKSISDGGTNFRDALRLSMERFGTKTDTSRAIVLLSDG